CRRPEQAVEAPRCDVEVEAGQDRGSEALSNAAELDHRLPARSLSLASLSSASDASARRSRVQRKRRVPTNARLSTTAAPKIQRTAGAEPRVTVIGPSRNSSPPGLVGTALGAMTTE